MEELSIKIEHVSKQYRLGTIGGGTLKGDLQTWWAHKRGKEDPNSMIGVNLDVKTGEKFLALEDINLTVRKGEALGIIGHNGAGKSTLLKLLSRVTAPTTGKISYNGNITSMLEVGTGFHPELTGRENIYMNGAILGLTRGEIDTKIEEIIDFSEVRQFIDTPVKRYSSGMYVKLAFSVAAHLDSEIMIMDEVLAVGDMSYQKKCLTKMREAAFNEGRTILYVSHNMNTIRQLCDRCVVLDHGKIIFDGNVEEAISIYMNVNAESAIEIDYTTIPRLKWLRNTKVRTQRTLFVNKQDIFFSRTEPMRVYIQWLNEERVDNLCLRIEFLRPDRSPIGTAFLYDFYSGNEGERSAVTISADISMLAPARYAMTYTFFQRNEYGSNRDVDCVHGLNFEIVNNGEIVWNERAWGYYILPSLRKESEYLNVISGDNS